MNNILVKSTNGLVLGALTSLSAVLITNSFYKKDYDTFYNYFKIKSYIPAMFGGLVGFSLGYSGKPLIYHFLYKK
jgi:hypothetical protein